MQEDSSFRSRYLNVYVPGADWRMTEVVWKMVNRFFDIKKQPLIYEKDS